MINVLLVFPILECLIRFEQSIIFKDIEIMSIIFHCTVSLTYYSFIWKKIVFFLYLSNILIQ